MKYLKTVSAILLTVLLATHPFSTASAETVPLQPDPISKVTLDFKGMDVVEALKIISSQGGMNLVMGEQVKGRVTLFLKDVDIQDAFDIVLAANDLAYEKRGEIIYVMTQKEYETVNGERFAQNRTAKVISLKYAKAVELAKSLAQARPKTSKIVVDESTNSLILVDNEAGVRQMESIINQIDQPTIRKIFELKYAVAKDLKDKIQEYVSKGIGSVQADERSNHLTVTDLVPRMPELQRVIEMYDQKPRQVIIDAKIVQVTLDDAHQLGVDWESVFEAMHRDFNLRNRFLINSATTFNPGLSATIGVFGSSNYAMLVQALKTVGDTNTLSSPKITVLNNQEAKILVGENRPYAVNTVVQTTGSTTTASQLNFIEIGVKLYVTPTINEDGFVTMKIRPEVSSKTGDYTYGDPVTVVPIVSTTQAETSVTVQNGRTIIIAGLIKDDRFGSVSKVPFAGDIPILGNLFKKTDNNIVKQELVIFITPRIVSGSEDILEFPKSKATDKLNFTMKEDYTFERRNRLETNAGMFVTDADGRTERFEVVASPEKKDEYYYNVKDAVLNKIQLPRKASKDSQGKVKIAFTIASDGALITEPEILESSGNKNLEKIALKAVKGAAPFAPFNGLIAQQEKKFVIDLAFE